MSVPKLRFKSDDGNEFPEWEESSFSETFTGLNNNTLSRDSLNEQEGTFQDIHYGDILIKYESIVNMDTDTVPFINNNIDCSKYALLKDGDIVIADTAEDETVGKAIEIQNVRDKLVVSGLHTMAWRPKEQFASMYLGYYMNSSTYHDQLRPYMQGIKVTSISKANIALTTIARPCISEQQQIAKLFNAIDLVIEQTQSEIDAWEKQKRGVMQLLFSRKVRFKADDGSEFPEWEEKRLSDIAEYVSEGINAHAISAENYVSTENILKDFNGIEVSTETPEAGILRKFKVGDILMSNIRPYLKKIWLSDKDGACNSDVLIIRPKDSIDREFLYALLARNEFIQYVMTGAKGSKMPRGDKAVIMNYNVPDVNIAEQQKIAACLSGFDDVIGKAKQELEAYRELKKGLLQQMFV